MSKLTIYNNILNLSKYYKNRKVNHNLLKKNNRILILPLHPLKKMMKVLQNYQMKIKNKII